MAARFLRALAKVYTSATSNSSSEMERFIVGGRGNYATLPRKAEDAYEFINVSSVPLATVNQRLGLIFNSLFMALVMRSNPDLSHLARYRNASTTPRSDIDMFAPRPPPPPPRVPLSTTTTSAAAAANESARLIKSVFAAMGRAAATVRMPIYVCAFAWMATLLVSARRAALRR
jgi:hypothetical protein